jgi:hypothetical protein
MFREFNTGMQKKEVELARIVPTKSIHDMKKESEVHIQT